MRRYPILFTIILLLAGICTAQITFTGDASADFNNPLTVWAYDPCGENDVVITSQMQAAGVLSGWDIWRIGFYYDRANDVMYIGWDFNGRICGDADGDGDPSDETYLQPNKHDVANLGDGETICLWVDTDNSGGSEGGDIVLGVSKPGDASEYAVTYENAGYGNPLNSFGAPIPEATGSYLYNAPDGPDPAHPDFECTVQNYSQMPSVNLGDRYHDEVSFGIHVYTGSWEDGSVGFDKFTNSCWLIVTIPGVPVTDTTITHNFPRDLYVLEGIPLAVENGDPPTVLGPPFSTNPPGQPNNWRVSRWDTDLQIYLRYNEPEPDTIDLGDPPPLQPGMGFWIVQNLEDSCQVEVTGTFFEPGDTVRVPLQNALPDGTPGQNMLANPFHVPIAWGDCYIQRADHTEPPMTIEEAYTSGISCHYSAIWDYYNKQYIIKDLDDTFAPWNGFWTCVYDSLYEWEIIYVYPDEGDSEGLTANARPHDGPDELNEWAFYIGVVVDSLKMVDQCNYIGISANSSDVWDANDAPEMAPSIVEGAYVHLYFPHYDWSFRPGPFCFDFRQGPFDELKIWDFNIRSFQYTGDILLVWDGAAKLSPEYKASLYDNSGNMLVEDMALEDTMPIYITAGEIQEYQIQVERISVDVSRNPDNIVKYYSLSEPYPNPFNPVTSLKLDLYKASDVKAVVYNIEGREVMTAADECMSAGSHNLNIDLSQQASGQFFLKISIGGGQTETKKLLLIK
ncbi:T9SS type A sorting domain-containing protein [bacterium]|nr:T9SS type A sorting domain-containing protein [bacterium]